MNEKTNLRMVQFTDNNNISIIYNCSKIQSAFLEEIFISNEEVEEEIKEETKQIVFFAYFFKNLSLLSRLE